MRLLAVLLLAAATAAMSSAASLYDVTARSIDGADVKLVTYRGKVLLVVNVASECGYTGQYEGLQALYAKYADRGLVVLGFPCNQFGAQEPGSAAEIKKFCTTSFRVTFPLFDKIEVNGPRRHPVYAYLAGKDSPFPGNIAWNFAKFLVGRDGRVLARFDAGVEPADADLIARLESALAAR